MALEAGNPAHPQSTYPQNTPTPILRDTRTSLLKVALCTVAKDWKKPKDPPIGDWLKKLWGVYSVEHCSARRKHSSVPFRTKWTQMEGI